MQPCEQKDNIEQLFKMSHANKDQLHSMEVRQVEIFGDVKHVRERFDNGFSKTIAEMNKTLAELAPKIEHHARWIGYFETAFQFTFRTFILALIGVLGWALFQGWKP